MRKVLIPTDFSKNAWNAIKYAVELFKYEVSEFYIMHAYKDEIYEDKNLLQKATLDSITQIVGNKSEELLNKTLLDISEYSSNPKHKYNTISSNNLLIAHCWEKRIRNICWRYGTRGVSSLVS